MSRVAPGYGKHWLRRHAALLTALYLLFLAGHVFGQQGDSAIVVGTVFDPGQLAIASATVRFTHLGTNAATVVRTDERGQYRTPPLRLGEYAVSITANGFKRFDQRGVVLNLGDVRQLDAVLAVGQVTETVVVEAAPPLLETQSSTVGTVITNKQIRDLPLNGRDYLQLATLSSGTAPLNNANSQTGVSIGGQLGVQAAYLLDGQDNNSQEIYPGVHSKQKEVIKPSVDAIEEFKVVTNSYAAEYGRSSSGVVSVALKQGSNQFHGTAYEFLRNDALDATSYFAKSKAPYKRNQFGGTFGGPVLKNRLFFFGDAEFARIRQSYTTISTVPTDFQRQGIFASTIKDPTTGKPFANNTIPQERMDPIALKILNLIPTAQTPATSSNYVYNSPAKSNPYSWDFRVDQIVSDKQSLYFRFSSQQKSDDAVPSLPPNAQLGYYAGQAAQTTDSKGFVLVHNRVWTSNIVSNVHLGWNYTYWQQAYPAQALKGIGIPGVDTSYPGFSGITVNGYGSTNQASTSTQYWGVSNVPNADGSQNRQVSGEVSWTKGTHTLKFGAQFYWLQTSFFSSQQLSGTFAFTGRFTGNPLADFLLGYANSASLSDWAKLEFRVPYKHFFVQDDWKVSRRFTLNYGLRYELSPPAVEKDDKIANFDIDTDPTHPQLVLAGSEGSDRASRALQNVNNLQFAPRVGFAWSLPDDKTVVRGGYGIFYSNFITMGGMQSMEINPPNHLRVNLSSSATSPVLLSRGFAANTLSLANAKYVGLVSYDRSNVAPTAQQWNLNIQRQLPASILLEVGYYGNKFDHAWWQADGNPALPRAGNTNDNRRYTSASVPGTPYPFSLADICRIRKDGYSRYHALQTKLEKRYQRGLTFIASYSYSKSIALGDGSNTSGAIQNPWNLKAERSVSLQDLTHHFIASAVYELPFGRGKSIGNSWNGVADAILGGWSVAPIVTRNSGFPLNITVNGNPSNAGGGVGISAQADRPNVVGDWHLANPTAQQWFNTAAFAANAPYTFGNLGRNAIRGPGLFNLDFAAYKRFRFGERLSGQFRAEAFNVTNTPAFGNPNVILGTAGFGQITSAGSPRDIQLGVKLAF